MASGVKILSADHGYDSEYSKTLNEGQGMSSLAAMMMNLLDFEASAGYDKSLITMN